MATSSVGLGRFNLLPITGSWSIPIALYSVFLANRIVYYRVTTKTFFGDRPSDTPEDFTDTHPLYRATRTFGNFVETAPLAITLGALLELNGATKSKLNYALGLYFVSKVLHLEGGLMAKADGMGLGRPVGFYGSQAFFIGTATYLTYLLKGYWGF